MKKRMIIGATAGALILALTTASVYASSSAAGSGYVDDNNDGICDNYDVSLGGGQSSEETAFYGADRCAQYTDENNDGVCDHCQNGNRAMDGSGNQYGRQEKTQCDHEQMNHGYCHRNQR
ncbi:MAG: hypothetical protein V8S30_02075 [Merdibacter sp.]